MREKRHDQSDEIKGLLRAVKDSTFGLSESLAALSAKEATFFLMMNANIALISLASGRAILVRAKYIFWGQRGSFFTNVHGKIVA